VYSVFFRLRCQFSRWFARFPEQRLTREEALRGQLRPAPNTASLTLTVGMTLDPAYASFTEDMLGSITPGKRADYVILNQDIMTIPAEAILRSQVVATVIDGRPVFGKV
jgi:predicted amidohydrolase YtcJ